MNTPDAKDFVENILTPYKDTPDSPEKAYRMNEHLKYIFDYFNQKGFSILNEGGRIVGVDVEFNQLSKSIYCVYVYQQGA